MNPMFDEVECYYPGFWKTVAVHEPKQVKGFFGPFWWLSNFYLTDVWLHGLKYPSSENAYQAMKVELGSRHLFTQMSPKESKKAWVDMPKAFSAEQWDEIKYEVMAEALFSKFTDKKLKGRLLALDKDVYLEETNWWSDIYWGVDIKKGGENNLGKLLMKLRRFWDEE